jgi:hypothetical protein
MRDLPGQDLSADRQAQSFPRVNAGFIKHVPVADGGLRPDLWSGLAPDVPSFAQATEGQPHASQRPGVALAKTGFRPRLATAPLPFS